MKLSVGVLAIAALNIGGLLQPAQAGGPAWIESWAAAPSPPYLVERPGDARSASFAGETLREVIRISAGGNRLRIRFTNEYGNSPLRIGAAHIALAGDHGAIRPGNDKIVTFDGQPQAVIPAGAPLLSDPIDMAVAPLSTLSISIYLPDATGPCTCHPRGMQTIFLSGKGNFTAAAAFPTSSTARYRAFLSGVEVESPDPGGVIVTLGDSITDGSLSTLDADKRWPDRLAERLAARGNSLPIWAVANAGIGGNKLLADGAGASALARFDRDVLSVPGVRYVVVLIGVNDIGDGYSPNTPADPISGRPTAGAMIAGYKQLIARAHERGLRIFGATITPFAGADYWSVQGEAQRQAINAWMRSPGAFDGVIDFDAVWRDPDHPNRIRPGLGAPDHLHGSDAGYQALGDAAYAALFH